MTLDSETRAELVALGVDPDRDLDELVAELEQEQARDLAWVEQVQDRFPLAVSELWRAPGAAWDQRRAAVAICEAPGWVVLVKGGNRSGKTRAAVETLIVHALGREHPVTQAWCALNQIDQESIPSGPGTVAVLAQTHDDSILYHRWLFEELLGSVPHVWHNYNAREPARCAITVPGFRRKGRLLFRAVSQGREGQQGFSARLAMIDEEPLEPHGPGVVAELKMRLLDQRGRLVVTYAALSGLTWMHQRYEVERADRCTVVELDTLDNPHLPQDHVREVFAAMDEDELAQRRFGAARSREGLVYSMFQHGDGSRWGPGHVCDPFEIPADATRYRAGDFGLVHPTCMGWGFEADDGTLYVYREYYRPNGESYAAHAAACALLEGWTPQEREDGTVIWVRGDEVVETGWGDPSQPQAIKAFRAVGLHLSIPPFREVRQGIDAVMDRLRIRGDGRPRLKLFRGRCPNLERELGLYRWDPSRRDEAPVKKDDHAPDMLRYMVVGIDRYTGV